MTFRSRVTYTVREMAGVPLDMRVFAERGLDELRHLMARVTLHKVPEEDLMVLHNKIIRIEGRLQTISQLGAMSVITSDLGYNQATLDLDGKDHMASQRNIMFAALLDELMGDIDAMAIELRAILGEWAA